MKEKLKNLPFGEQVSAARLLKRVKEAMDSYDPAEGMGAGLWHDKVFKAIKWAYDKGCAGFAPPPFGWIEGGFFTDLVEGWLLSYEETGTSADAFRLKALCPQAYDTVLEIVVQEFWERLRMPV